MHEGFSATLCFLPSQRPAGPETSRFSFWLGSFWPSPQFAGLASQESNPGGNAVLFQTAPAGSSDKAWQALADSAKNSNRAL
jgi:hypothetical protein